MERVINKHSPGLTDHTVQEEVRDELAHHNSFHLMTSRTVIVPALSLTIVDST